jgi:superfamily I DNA and/or RNA helicase
MRYHPNGGRDIDWNFKPFDLAAFDEAAQLNLPESLLAAAFLHDKGNVIAVGDHRQMPPIVAHPWEQELKRTVMEQRPFLSLFEYLLERGFPCVGLDQSFRLHKTVAEFLYENIYKHDGIKFFSKNIQLLEQAPPTNPFVDSVLGSHHPIVVVEHDEKASHQFNELELDLLIPIVDVVANKLRLDGLDGIGVVVPHRAQKALLRKQFPRLSINDAIDTVERFQGDERDVVIVSATASDPDYVLAEAGFLLDLNRLNVAMSRSRRKLIVIASRSVVELLTSDLHVFENAAIWKRLYQQYAWEKLFSGSFSGITVRVRGAPPHNSEAAEQAS